MRQSNPAVNSLLKSCRYTLIKSYRVAVNGCLRQMNLKQNNFASNCVLWISLPAEVCAQIQLLVSTMIP